MEARRSTLGVAVLGNCIYAVHNFFFLISFFFNVISIKLYLRAKLYIIYNKSFYPTLLKSFYYKIFKKNIL